MTCRKAWSFLSDIDCLMVMDRAGHYYQTIPSSSSSSQQKRLRIVLYSAMTHCNTRVKESIHCTRCYTHLKKKRFLPFYLFLGLFLFFFHESHKKRHISIVNRSFVNYRLFFWWWDRRSNMMSFWSSPIFFNISPFFSFKKIERECLFSISNICWCCDVIRSG